MRSNIKINNATLKDLNQILDLEKEVWPEEMRASKERFEERLKIFGKGFFIITIKNKIMGATTSQIIDYNPKNPPNSWDEITGKCHISQTHNQNGNCLYIISLGVSPKIKGKNLNLGSKLLNKQKQLGEELNLKYILLSARVPEYNKFCKEVSKVSIEAYSKLKRKDGLSIDRGIRFYERNGFKQVKICPNTMKDKESRNYGIIMELKL